jgi:FixJ family two-component response regulator
VDDDRDMRDSLLALLAALGYRAQGFASAEEFRTSFEPRRAGCLILDIRMPGQSGLELYADLLRAGERLPVIFMTAHADVSTAVAAMKTGAIEFLEKPFSHETLVDRINRALQLDASWRKEDERFRVLDAAIGELSDVDRETLDMILEAASNKVMAARLFITERAVELRRQRLMRRLGVGSVAELLRLAVTHRVLSEIRRVQSPSAGIHWTGGER